MPLYRAYDKRKEGTIENQSMLLDLAWNALWANTKIQGRQNESSRWREIWMREVFEMWQQMTVGENSSIFGPWPLSVNWKKFNLRFLTWFPSYTVEAMVFQMYCPTCTGKFFSGCCRCWNIACYHEKSGKKCCKLTHFWYPRVAFFLAFMLIPYRNREL